MEPEAPAAGRSGSHPTARHPEHNAADRALRWLRSRRLIVVDVDRVRAQLLEQALRACGATALAVSRSDADLQPAHALDAEVMLVAADDPCANQPIVDALQGHPRTRWAAVLPITSAQPSSGGAQPDLASIANEVEHALAPAVELAVRAKGKLPHETRLEALGPYRTLRVLADTGRALHVVLWDGRIWAELDLEDGRVCGARAHGAEPEHLLSRAHALAAVLELSCGHVRIEDRPAGATSDWNVSLSAALARAAVIGSLAPAHGVLAEDVATIPPAPAAPQISLAEVMGDGDAVEASGAEPGLLIELPPSEPPAAAVPVLALEPARVASTAVPATKRIRAHRVAAAAFVGLALGGAALLALELAGGLPAASGIRHLHQAPVGGVAAGVAPRAALAPRERSVATAEATPAAPASIELATPAATAAVANGAGGRELDSAPKSSVPRAQLARAERLERRARRYHRARQLGKAELTYHEALEAWSGHSLAMAGLARIHLQRKQAQEALRWAERLVALQPDRDINQLLLGDALAMSGNRSEAESAWQRAKQLGSRTASSRLRGRSSLRP